MNGAIVNWNHPNVTTCKPCKDTIPGFVYMGTYLGNRYFCSRQTATWPDAKYICESVGGKLCVINSLDENQWVASN
ncbi:MAG: C-type lectin domain-containing protein [Saprospiraceae bacterium]|nr:C-type lectin domain-containing protein [Saprospiraceae bacterium]